MTVISAHHHLFWST